MLRHSVVSFSCLPVLLLWLSLCACGPSGWGDPVGDDDVVGDDDSLGDDDTGSGDDDTGSGDDDTDSDDDDSSGDDDDSSGGGDDDTSGDDDDDSSGGDDDDSASIDSDADGFSVVEDCDDTNPLVYPGATENPSGGIDDDCDGTTDEGMLVSSLAPDDGFHLGGTTVTITGSGFTGVESVTLGAVAVSYLSVESDTEIEISTPAGTVGLVALELTNSYGSVTTSDAFTYTGDTSTLSQAQLTGSDGGPVASPPVQDTTNVGVSTVDFFAVVEQAGVTDSASESTALQAEIGMGFQGMSPVPDGSSPSPFDSWTWYPATYEAQSSFNTSGTEDGDLYSGSLQPASYGSYLVTFRFSIDGGLNWIYADSDPATALDPNEMWNLDVRPEVCDDTDQDDEDGDGLSNCDDSDCSGDPACP